MRVVLDTNVLVSALLWRGAPYRCLIAIQAGLVELVLSPPILHELRDVLIRKFRHTANEADEAVAFIRTVSKHVEISGQVQLVVEDPADDKFIETAQVAGANFIVSGDRHLLALGARSPIQIITARILLDNLG